MNTPTIYTPESLKHTTKDIAARLPDGRLVAARPLGWQGICLHKRLHAAWMVFAGRWEGQ